MGEQLLSSSILDQFINSHEQSYDEFLKTFTNLVKDLSQQCSLCKELALPCTDRKKMRHEEAKCLVLVHTAVHWQHQFKLHIQLYDEDCRIRVCDARGNTEHEWRKEEGKTTAGGKEDSLSKTFSASELSNRSKEDRLPGRSEEMGVSPPPYMPKVDEHLDLEDVDTDEKMCSAESLLLPGEVDQTVTYCPPVLDKPVQQKFRPLPVPQPSCSKAQELLGDDVQPFSLDEEFDYDNVALTPKFSEAELKAIVGLSEEKKTGTDVKSAQAED